LSRCDIAAAVPVVAQLEPDIFDIENANKQLGSVYRLLRVHQL